MKHRLMLGAAASLLAAACGSDKSPRRNDAQTGSASAPPPPAAPTANGAAVFARTCQVCHQVTGQGMPNSFPPLAGSPIVNGGQARVIRIALHGLQGPITVNGKRFNNVMPPWKSLSDADLAVVLTFVRSSWGNTGTAVSEGDVARERAATASRTTMWTIQELERSP
jgi:mono/diheme cytochrome c family protein